jgi:imidazolonepropionase-like amidohydrolase
MRLLSTGISAAVVGGFLTAGFAGQPAGPAVRAFTNVTLIDGTGAGPIADGTLVVEKGRITAAGPAARVRVPAGAAITSLAGKWMIPGLVNAHGHVGDTEGLEGNHYSAANVARDLSTYAAYGVTTVVSLGGDQQAGFDARAAQNTPALTRSRIFVAGPVLAPSSPDEARRLVDEDAAMKVDIVKIRVDDNLGTTAKMKPEIYRAVIDEAHKKGLRVAVHLFYLNDAKAVLDAGADFIAHSIRDQEVDGEVIAALKKRDVCVCPTLMREVSTFVYETTPPFFSDPLFLKRADPRTVAKLRQPVYQQAMAKSRAAQLYKAGLDIAMANVKKLEDAGVTIAMGTDTGPPARFQGYFELMELEMMARAGLTPRQILASATRDAARCMKIDREVGTLEPGKWADFVVVNADPLADISNVKKIDSVWIAGNAIS